MSAGAGSVHSLEPGRCYRLTWSWGRVGGTLCLLALERRAPLLRARLSLATNPAVSRILLVQPLADRTASIELRSIPGDGIPRPSPHLATHDPSLRWLYRDAAYLIRLEDGAGGLAGTSDGDVAWLLTACRTRG